MMRPNMVRADTIDLQDPGSPSAADHSRQTPSSGLAPHQAAEVHHIVEERHSEEQALADAWNIAHNLSIDEPGAIDQAHVDHLHHDGVNGAEHHDEEGAEGAEAENDGEDDMMDRISSSPSIDDGGYLLHSSPPTTPCTPWPDRKSSKSPRSSHTMREAFNKSASSSPDSSPFLLTPDHFPLASDAVVEVDSASSAQQIDALSSSPCVTALRTGRFPSPVPDVQQRNPPLSSMHHHLGRYGRALGNTMNTPNLKAKSTRSTIGPGILRSKRSWEHCPVGSIGLSNSLIKQSDSKSATRTSGAAIWGTASASIPGQSKMTESPSLSSIQSVDLESILLPLNDPLLDRPVSPTESQASWGSTSESVTDQNVSPDQGLEYRGDTCKDDNDDDDDNNNDDDARDAFVNSKDRFVDSGWGGECLRETEDIDFDFVYALHTFVATVEGQANATKGDTMVLLDDSNSYWWLVRVVKDNSIGYLPAEHIETPTERLARLNKHRNIDLSATMLSDNSEKPMSTLKKAMRRRNVRVQFAAPTYVEASDNDYSTEDEDQTLDPYSAVLDQDDIQENTEAATQTQAEVEEVKEQQVEKRSSTSSNRASFDREQAAMAAQALAEAGVTADDDPQTAPKLVDKTEAAPLKSRKGTPRNTDSFLKDDTIETRKITLTPGLLREETGSLESPIEQSRSNSLDSLQKVVSPSDSSKKDGKDKKKEPKKGGMFSGLFKSKKKDKKAKEANGDAESDKQSMDIGRESPKDSITSGKASPVEKIVTGLQVTLDPATAQEPHQELTPVSALEVQQDAASESGFIAELPGSEVAYEMATGHEDAIAESRLQVTQADKAKDGKLSPITNILLGEGKPPKAKRSKRRVQLDDFDSPPEIATNPFDDPQDDEERLSDSPVEISPHTFMHGTESIHIPVVDPDATEDDAEEDPASLTSSPSIIDHPSEPLEEDGTHTPAQDSDPTPTGPRSPQEPTDRTASITPLAQPKGPEAAATRATPTVTTTTTTTTAITTTVPPATTAAAGPRAPSPAPSNPTSPQTWSDAHLRSWLDESSEVRDMLVIIRDQTGVVPVPHDHPLMSDLYAAPRKGVRDMMGELDGLLGSYLQRKGVRF